MKHKFWGTVNSQGNATMNPPDMERFTKVMSTRQGKEFYLVLKWPEEIRSMEQNAYIHWAFEFIAKHVDLKMDDVKTMAKIALIPAPKYEVVRRLCLEFTPTELHPDVDTYAEFLWDAELTAVGRPTSELSVQECKEFIEKIPPWAWEEFSVSVPLPGEVEV